MVRDLHIKVQPEKPTEVVCSSDGHIKVARIVEENKSDLTSPHQRKSDKFHESKGIKKIGFGLHLPVM